MQQLVQRSADLAVFRREGRALVVAPDGGGSCLLDDRDMRLLQRLQSPAPLEAALGWAQTLGMRDDEALRALQGWFERGLLVVSGRRAPRTPVSVSPVLVLQVAPGCSPSCPICERSGPAMSADMAREAVERGLRELGSGLVLQLTGGTALGAVEAVRAAVGRCPTVLHTPPGDLGPFAGLPLTVALALSTPVDAAGLVAAVESGLHVVPSVVVREPEHYAPAFHALVELGFRTFRLNAEPRLGWADAVDPARAEAFARALVAVAREAGEMRVPMADFALKPCGPQVVVDASGAVRTGPLHVAEVVGNVAGGPSWDSLTVPRSADRIPRCGRCPFRRFCEGGSALKARAAFGTTEREDPLCRFYQVAVEELLWLSATGCGRGGV